MDPAQAVQGQGEWPADGSMVYEVVQRLTVANHGPGRPDKQDLWVALIGDVDPYQRVLFAQISPSDYQVVTDEQGNRYAEFNLADNPAPGQAMEIELRYQVAVTSSAVDLSDCQGELPRFFTEPEVHVESNNPQIIALSADLSRGTESACEQARALYDYVAENLVYTVNGGDWGAQAALGEMGADCTEYASLLTALSRAAGIPARYLEGLYFSPNGSGALARIEHAWLEIYLPGVGWAPMDPTVGRLRQTRDAHFAALPADHIIVTKGRNPSTLRGDHYWTHLYWPGNSTDIRIEGGWDVWPVNN